MAKSVVEALKALRKPVIATIIVAVLLMCHPKFVLAASGGRMGGSAFPKSSSSASYSASSTSSGGSYSGGGSNYIASNTGGGGSDIWYFGGPSVGCDFGCPVRSPSVDLSSSKDVSTDSKNVSKIVPSTDLKDVNGAVELVKFVIMITVVPWIVCLVSEKLSYVSDRRVYQNPPDVSNRRVLTDTKKTSVLKLQVGLLGSGRSLQKDLNRIAEIADTSSARGLHFVLMETVLALLRHPDYCISAYSSVEVKRDMEEGEKLFNQLSVEERGKFDEETLVNVNNIKKQSSTRLRSSGLSNEYIVVTILVAAVGVHELPSINSSKELKDALLKLASIPLSRTLAVEVLWTPQEEDDTLLEQELQEDYPLLRPL